MKLINESIRVSVNRIRNKHIHHEYEWGEHIVMQFYGSPFIESFLNTDIYWEVNRFTQYPTMEKIKVQLNEDMNGLIGYVSLDNMFFI